MGLTAITLTLLRNEGVATDWANPLRFTLLALAVAWSLRFEWRLSGQRSHAPWQRSAAVALVAAELDPEKGLSIADPIDGLPRRMTLVTVKPPEGDEG